MDQQFCLNSDEYIIPSQGHFGNSQILYFTARGLSCGQRQQIRSIKFNAQKDSKKWLCEKLSEETHLLVQQIKAGEYTQDQCSIYYLKKILKHIVKDADQTGMTKQHKILYLTFEFLLHVIIKRATTKNIEIEDKISLHQWLTDIDTLFYKQKNRTNSSSGESIEEEMIENLRLRDYESLLTNLQVLGATNTHQSKKKMIELVTKMVYLKIENTEMEFALQSKPQELRLANREVFISLQKLFAEMVNNRKEPNQGSNDKLRFVGQVLQKNPVYLNSLVKGSWPLYLSHVYEINNKQTDYGVLKDEGYSFLSRIKEALSPETEYLLNLLENKELHVIYQSLFSLVGPYYSHLIAYHFYYFYEAAPMLVIMEEDYMNDLARNMLLQASQVSYICLFLTFKFVENNAWIERKGEMFEPLLYYHLSIVDFDDQNEVGEFLRKINLLSVLSLQKYAYSHLKRVFFTFIENDQLNAAVIECYLVMSTLYAKYTTYDFDMVEFIDKYFATDNLNPEQIRQILNIGKRLEGKRRNKRQLQKFQQILPSFDKFIWLEQAKSETDIQNKMKISIKLMKITMRSLPLTQLLKDIIFTQQQQNSNIQLSNEYSSEKVCLHEQFYKFVRRFIDHYPKNHTQMEQELIRAIDLAIG